MSEEALYERYKSALRVGHVAAVRGRHEAALSAYGDAAALAPDRPLPYANMGRVLLRLDRVSEALEAYATALRLAPRDETSLAGRADALVAAGRPAEAAGVLDLLAETQQGLARLPDACDTARRALELAESRARRRYLESLAAELRTWPAERGGEDQLARALRTLEAAPVAAPSAAVGEPRTATATDSGATTANAPGSPAEAVAETAVQIVVPEAVPALPPLDVGGLALAIEDAVETGDPVVVHDVILGAVAAMRRAGLLDAAIDACQLGLTVAPGDPDLHLALAELDLDHGWTSAAADKLLILDRFVELTDNGPARARLWALVEERIPDDPRLTALRA